MNNLNFDELVLLLENMKKIKGEECLICQLPIKNNEDSIQLKCKHNYHSKCINIKNKYISCPYCNHVTLQNDIIKKENLCTAIIKSGINKGKTCNRINCKIHKKLQNDESDKSNMCKVKLKSGINKGNFCNRINCHYHKKNTLNI